jgi:hypothetical protein
MHYKSTSMDEFVNQFMQAAELLGGFDGAGPIGFRGHIMPDEGGVTCRSVQNCTLSHQGRERSTNIA